MPCRAVLHRVLQRACTAFCKDVLKALAEPKLVAVFVRQLIGNQPRDLSDPEPVYLATIREGTVVLIVTGSGIFLLKP
jgi:hypothetical protein